MADKRLSGPETGVNPEDFIPALALTEGQPRASSFDIAKNFEKNHRDVLRDLRVIFQNIPDSFRERNFAPTQADVKMPTGGIRKIPAYNLTRDGFMLLAMGFTGPKAMALKIRYIEAFNAMEETLRRQASERDAVPPTVPMGKRPRSLAFFQDKELLELLLTGHSQAEAARRLGVSETSVYKRLRRLEQEGMIRLERQDGVRPAPAPKQESRPCVERFHDLRSPETRLNEAKAMLERERCEGIAALRELNAAVRAVTEAVRVLAGSLPPAGRNAAAAAPLPVRIPQKPVARTQPQRTLLAYFRKHGSHISTYRTISLETGIPYATIRGIVGKLKAEGFLQTKQWGSGSSRGLQFLVTG